MQMGIADPHEVVQLVQIEMDTTADNGWHAYVI